MDVHINRVPYGGTLTRVTYQPGRFLPAYRSESGAQNERTELWVEREGRTVVFRQVVGVLARRVVCRVREGETVKTGDRFGLMKFGSRMDVFVDRDARLLVAAGRCRARRRDAARRVPALPDHVSQGRRSVLKARRFVPDGAGRRARMRRGAYLLPSLLTLGNLFCGYACVIFALRHAFEQAAMFIGFAIVLDMLDGRVARMTGTSSAFGVEFDSLADVVSFGMAPAVLCFAWGLKGFDQAGWAATFVFVSAAAIRLARFNIQTNVPASTSATSSACRARRRPACRRRRCSRIRNFVAGWPYNLLALPMVLGPAFLMVSTVRYRSFKSIDMGTRRSYRGLLLMALVIAAIATHPQITLLVVAYGYLASGLIGWAWGRLGLGRRVAAEAPAPIDVSAASAPLAGPTPLPTPAGRHGLTLE